MYLSSCEIMFLDEKWWGEFIGQGYILSKLLVFIKLGFAIRKSFFFHIALC